MYHNDKSKTVSDGRELLYHLFEVAKHRLREQNISLYYTPCVIDSLLHHSDWIDSLNPLRTLDGQWRQQIATPIEQLLLAGRLGANNRLLVHLDENMAPPCVRFDIVNAETKV